MQNDKSKFKENFIKRLIKFSIKVLKLSEKARKKRVLWSLIDQLIRSATSIGANVKDANEIAKILASSILTMKKRK